MFTKLLTLQNTLADQREGKLNINGEELKINLYDLPCMVETLKTNDTKTFFKTGNISQVYSSSVFNF